MREEKKLQKRIGQKARVVNAGKESVKLKFADGVKLWNVGVDTAKDLLLGQLSIETPGPGYIHFSHELPTEFYLQLTAEQRILSKVGGRDMYRWVKRRPRNEQLDIRNYALHAAYSLGLHNYTDRRWADLEAAVQPAADLFTAPAVEAISVAVSQPTHRPTADKVPAVAPQQPARPAPAKTQFARSW